MRCVSLLSVLGFACMPAYQRSQQDADRAPSEAEFGRWLIDNDRSEDFRELEEYLTEAGVHGVVETWQLLRQGTDWREVEHPPFAFPPREYWDGMIPTLQFVRDHIEPRIGSVEVVSGFRSESFNSAAGGSSGSRHKFFEAIDMVPRERQSRARLHRNLDRIFSDSGEANSLGMGLYLNTRFHIDTWRHRRW